MMPIQSQVRALSARVVVFPRGRLPDGAALAAAQTPVAAGAPDATWARFRDVLGRVLSGTARAYGRGETLDLWLADRCRTRHATGLASLLGHAALDVASRELELPVGPATLGSVLCHALSIEGLAIALLDPARPWSVVEVVATGADAELRLDAGALSTPARARLSLLGFRTTRPTGRSTRWIGLATLAERQASAEVARRAFTEALGLPSGRLIVRVALA